MYITPGPRIFSFECSHPWVTLLAVLPRWFQSSPPRYISSDHVFFPVFILFLSCWEDRVAVARLHVLSEVSAAELPCNLETASSFTAEERFLMAQKLPVEESFKWDALGTRVERVVCPPCSFWRFSGEVRYGEDAEMVSFEENLLLMDQLWTVSSTDVTESFLKRLYLERWSMPFYLESCIRSGKQETPWLT